MPPTAHESCTGGESPWARFPAPSRAPLAQTKRGWLGQVQHRTVGLPGCGIASRKIAERMPGVESEKVYLGGMLHDIGSLIIYKEFPEEAKKILVRCKESGENLFKVEKEVLGYDHAEVGALLLAEWKLPQRLVEVVKYHHSPNHANDYLEEACIVARADALAYEMKVGNSGEPGVPVLDPRVSEVVPVSDEEFDGLKEEIADQIDGTVRMFF